jgi:hypothetical protein
MRSLRARGPRRTLACASLGLGLAGIITLLVVYRDDWREKRVRVVVEGQLVRGAWQRPVPLRRIVEREKIRTIVTLTAINSSDPKFVDQSRVVREMGLRWVIIPMRGSRATLEQMALAADLLGDPSAQPVYFHCVAGHHRTSLAHAAYLIRHRGYSAEEAWQAVSELPWSRPDSEVDRNDRFLIAEFARVQKSLSPSRSEGAWEIAHDASSQMANRVDRGEDRAGGGGRPPRVDRVEPVDPQLRRASAGTPLPVGPDVGVGAEPDSS